MKVNKRALYALATYYEATNIKTVAKPAERKLLADMVVPCIEDGFNEKELYRSFQHGEIFFHPESTGSGFFYHLFNDENIAKLLRYIAKKGKFPPAKRLKYVV